MKDSFCNRPNIQQNTRHDKNYLPGVITPALVLQRCPAVFLLTGLKMDMDSGIMYSMNQSRRKKQPIIEKRKVELFLWYMKMPQSDDDRLTAAFLQSSIVSVGVPLFVAKAVTGVIALTGMTPSQFLNSIRKKRNLS
ncbi:MAG: hypothetical protein II621_00380 [Clostridia bacterium]|nr:hypothetical protein [Clostridia bacterium]